MQRTPSRSGHTSHVVGDGLHGHREGVPFDRAIATCSVRRIPAGWLEQVRPGGSDLGTVTGWFYSCGLARLTVGNDGSADGRFLTDDVSFMIARSQAAPTDLGDMSRVPRPRQRGASDSDRPGDP
jgi:protein-L-isoaspartate O-methyltransferase